MTRIWTCLGPGRGMGQDGVEVMRPPMLGTMSAVWVVEGEDMVGRLANR